MDRDELKLGDTALAVYASPQSNSDDAESGSGYVVLVDREGAVQTVETAVMDAGRLVWNADGLYFSDSVQDFRLDSQGLEVTDSPKPDFQISAHDMEGSVVSVYNDGWTSESDYRMLAIEHNARESRGTDLSGAFWLVSRCDDRLVAVAPSSGKFLGAYPEDSVGIAPRVLYSIWPGQQEPLAVTEAPYLMEDAARDAPCHDEVVHFLAQSGNPDGSDDVLRPVVVSWDATTGTREERDLVTGDGTGLPLGEDDLVYARYGAESLVGGELRWLGPDGTVRATDVTDGSTTELFDVGEGVVEAQFTHDSVFVLANPDGSDSATLTRYDLATGSSARVVSVPGLGSYDSDDMSVQAIAVSPQVLANTD
ncbi:hypothetical protein [Promicromonospora sp. NPDC023987]|uniref:hypothetical protein n=1 Tax=Promicromonospora sp. NPDC023987 TaxID=3155360 RepID=UPI0033D7F4C9